MRVKIFKALADPTRLEIIRMLYQNNKEMTFGGVGDKCQTSKANISYHFRALREAHLIKVRKEAQSKLVSLNFPIFEQYLPSFLDTL
ncbi:ArsR/SmtB family transcription factor [Shimazuella soli]|uniref:ArsR/SmtB family transcription factor n=1 Tax=Shimazuella soli TaxID=1892854 RepID=UPI003B837414